MKTHASTGEYEKAIEKNQQAIVKADEEFRKKLESCYKLYESNQPFWLPLAAAKAQID